MTRNSADSAAEPLITNDRNAAERSEEDIEDEIEVDESELGSPGAFVWLLTICAGISGLLFGYEYVDMPVSSRTHFLLNALADT